MKRVVTWAVVLGIAGFALVVALRQGAHEDATAIAAQPPAAPAVKAGDTKPSDAKPAEGKIAYTFKDDTEIQEFMKLSQQRQGIFLRMTVLQAYFSQERAALEELNNKIASMYKLDSTKNYSLDNQRRALVEVETPPALSAPAAGETGQGSAAQKP